VVNLGLSRRVLGQALSLAVQVHDHGRGFGEAGQRLGPVGGGVGALPDVREEREREHLLVERRVGLGVLEIGGGKGHLGGGGGELA